MPFIDLVTRLPSRSEGGVLRAMVIDVVWSMNELVVVGWDGFWCATVVRGRSFQTWPFLPDVAASASPS